MPPAQEPRAASHSETEHKYQRGEAKERIAHLSGPGERHDPVPERKRALVVGVRGHHRVDKAPCRDEVAGLNGPLHSRQRLVNRLARAPRGVRRHGGVVVRHRRPIRRVDGRVAHSLQLHSLPAIGAVAHALQRPVSRLVELLARPKQCRARLTPLRVECHGRGARKRQSDDCRYTTHRHRPSAVRRAVCLVTSSGDRGSADAASVVSAPVSAFSRPA